MIIPGLPTLLVERIRQAENLAADSQVPRDSKAQIDPVVPLQAPPPPPDCTSAKVAQMRCAVPASREVHHNSQALQSFEIWSLDTHPDKVGLDFLKTKASAERAK